MTCQYKTLLIAFLFLLLAVPNAQASADPLFNLVAPSVVKLTVRLNGIATLSGTGFFIADDGTIATNRHVVRNLVHENGYRLEVSTFDHRDPVEISNFEVGACGEKSEADICLIRVPLEALQVTSHSLRYLKLSAQGPLAGDPAATIGHPRDHDFTLTAGKIKSVQFNSLGSEEMALTTALGPGNSGGPIVNAKGELIGIASRYLNDQGLAVSFKEVRRVLTESEPFAPVALARDRIAVAMQKRMREKWKLGAAEKTPRQFNFNDEILTVSLPKIFDHCREVEEASASPIYACVTEDNAGVFTLQRFEKNAVSFASGRALVPSKLLGIAETAVTRDLSPLELKRLEAFRSKPLPAKCGRLKSQLFSQEIGCEFTVLNDAEAGAQSKNLWIRRGHRVYSFSTWMADPNRAGFFGEVPNAAVSTAQLRRPKKVTSVAQEAMKMLALKPFEWRPQGPRRLESPLLSSSQDR